MLTIKHIDMMGIERVWMAIEAQFVPKETQMETGDKGPSAPLTTFVRSWAIDGEEIRTHGGTVFVMNDKGATVSRWDLGPSNVPLREGVTALNWAHRT